MSFTEYIYKDESYEIIGLCMEVHKQLGPGFLEAVYKDALEYEFKRNGIPFTREQKFQIKYKDIVLNKEYYADFTVFGKIILEAKALDLLPDVATAQAINYLKASRFKLCLLINFGTSSLQIKRIIL